MVFAVRLTPNAGKNELSAPDAQGVFKVRVTAKPVDGEANEALIKLLSKVLKVPKTAVEIIQGLKSRNKTVRIECLGKIPEECYGKTV